MRYCLANTPQVEKVSAGKLKVSPCLFYVVNHHLFPKTTVWDQVNESTHFSRPVVGSAQTMSDDDSPESPDVILL